MTSIDLSRRDTRMARHSWAELVDDVEQADFTPVMGALLVRLLFSPEEGAFNIATGTATSVRSVIEAPADRRGGRALLRIGAIDPPAGEPPRLVADMTKVRARLGWSAVTSLEEGLSVVLGGG